MFGKRTRFLTCLCLLALVGAAPAQQPAATAKPPLGLAIASKTPLLNWYEKHDGQLVCVGTLNVLDVTSVEEEADYFRVRYSGRQGWVKRDDVVTMSQTLAYFKGRVERDPLDGYAQCMYAYELILGQQSAQAQIAAEEAVRLLPNDSRPRQVRTVLFILNGDAKGSLDDLKVAVRLDPSNSEIYILRSYVLGMVQRQYEEAILDLEKALSLSPNNENIYISRSSLWREKGDYRKAAADIDRAIRAYPDCLDAHARRAELLSDSIGTGVYNLPEAVVSARRACELTKWENGTHLRRLARLCERAGNKEEAVQYQEKAERLTAAQLPPLPAAKP